MYKSSFNKMFAAATTCKTVNLYTHVDFYFSIISGQQRFLVQHTYQRTSNSQTSTVRNLSLHCFLECEPCIFHIHYVASRKAYGIPSQNGPSGQQRQPI